MNRFLRGYRTWQNLSQIEQAQWLQAWMLLPIVSVGLRVFSLRRVQAFLCHPKKKLIGSVELSKVVAITDIFFSAVRWSVLPSTCLSQSLVLYWLLRRHGVDADFRIGIAKHHGCFVAHAWVEYLGIALEEEGVHQQFVAFERSIMMKEHGSL
jgi:hypothetical protein